MIKQQPGKRGRGRPRKHGTPQEPTKTTISIGNCRVEFPASLVSSADAQGLSINISDSCTVGIKVAKESPVALSGFSFTLLNPKSLDGVEKQLLQDVLKLYAQELPAMKYAANTGKESRFLESCIFGGRYCTLILRNAELELIGAMTYQMLPTDTNQAELPLAAVAQAHHRKGFGACLYKELQRRLFDVGVLSIFCWGDQESEAFWAKQGFVTVAEVDGRGKPWKLPIKADVRRAMSIPGSATLMISYLSSPSIRPASPGPPASPVISHKMTSRELSKTATENFPRRLNPLPSDGENPGQKLSPLSVTTPQVVGESKSIHVITVTPGQAVGDSAGREKSFRASITPFNMEGVFSTIAEEPKGNASKPLAVLVEDTRPSLVDITNSGSAYNAANKPLKKRPITRTTPQKSKVPTVEMTSTLDGEKENAGGKVFKANEARSPTDPKMSLKSPGRLQVPTSEVSEGVQVEVALDIENEVNVAAGTGMDYESIPAVCHEEKTGGKRGRESEIQMSVFSRRATRRRKADLAEGTEGRASKEKEKDNTDQVEDGVQQIFDPLLPQLVSDVGRCNAVDAGKSRTRDSQEPDRDRNGTTIIASSLDHPIAQTVLRKPFITEAGPTERSADAATELESCHGESGSSHCPPKEVIYSCRSAEQSMKKASPVIMLMSMYNENKKKQLTKHVQRLTGTVTSDGGKCTHVVTDEVRRTLNFCVAISSGAWILSPDWLKTSVKQKSFADEARFVLRDRRFEAKYKVSLQDVIRRAKDRSNLLLDGMSIYPTPHLHPPVETISKIVEAAGGKVLGSLEEVLQLGDKSQAVTIATEEDMSDAISAAKAGIRTFSSDWLLTCIVKQELDLTATQFSESL